MMDMEMNAGLDDEGSESSQLSSGGSSASSTLCNLEKDYAKITQEMKTNELLAPYEAEYTRLYESLYKCHKSEKELLEECSTLKDEGIEKMQKMFEMQSTIELNVTEIARLKDEIDKALKLADAAHSREQKTQEMIDNLRLNVKKLNQEIELKNKQIAGEDDIVVSKQKEGLLKEREKLLSEIDTLKQRLKYMVTYTEELETKVSTNEAEIKTVRENLEQRSNDLVKERKARERTENVVEQLQEELTIKTSDLQMSNEAIKSASNNIVRLESLLKDQRTLGEKLQKEINGLTVKRIHLQTDIDNASSQIDILEKEIAEKEKQLKMMRHEITSTKEENSKVKLEKELTEKKFQKIDNERGKLVQEIKQAQTIIKNVDQEMLALHKQQHDDKYKYEALVREKNVIARNNETLKGQIKTLISEVAVSHASKKKIERELDDAIFGWMDVKKQVDILEKERDKYTLEARELAQQVEDYMNEVKLKQVEIFDYKKRLAEADAKYRQQENLFEALRAERNACSKSLLETQERVQELKGKISIMTQQIEQLKEDVATREATLVKKEFTLGRAEKEKDALKLELQSVRKSVSDLRREVDVSKEEEKRLRQTIQTAERDIARQKKDIENVMNERDILGTQLVRRNDELSLQYGRIKVLNGTLQRGEAQYNQRLEDTRLLKLEVKKLRTEKILLSKSIDNTSDLRQEVFHLNRDLANERMKVMALEEEVQTPLNIHRWRKLEYIDPDAYEMLKKIQVLQKRVIKMAGEIIDKEKKIQDTEKLYMNLREILSRQPGPEVTVSLQKTQQALRERGKKMKCLVSELNVYNLKVNEYKYDIKRMNKEMCELKTKYYAQKRQLQKAKETRSKSLTEPILPAVSVSPQRKMFGGGFNMSAPALGTTRTIESTVKEI